LIASTRVELTMKQPAITPDQVRHLARLACLRLEDHEVEVMVNDLSTILDYMAVLRDVDVEASQEAWVEAMGLREDECREGLARDEALGQSGRAAQDVFVVPTFHRIG
jgi:aspartyl-tRNA(Asn)/glutamyl-tRNA(Gln) amidotransferase subunit C